MKRFSICRISLFIISACLPLSVLSESRQMVQLPEMMKQHMMANMRDHLRALDEILFHLAEGDGDKAAEIAEQRLGMSSLEAHGASHMSAFMPEGMRQTGTLMHKAASQFARTAEEGDLVAAYARLGGITSACVSCHATYRIR